MSLMCDSETVEFFLVSSTLACAGLEVVFLLSISLLCAARARGLQREEVRFAAMASRNSLISRTHRGLDDFLFGQEFLDLRANEI